MSGATVTGEIHWQGHPEISARARLYIRLLDVTESDGPSRTVAETIFDSRRLPGDGVRPISFVLDPDIVDQRRRYVVAAHLDLDGDGKVSPGDQITMQSYPVLTLGHPASVEIVLRGL